MSGDRVPRESTRPGRETLRGSGRPRPGRARGLVEWLDDYAPILFLVALVVTCGLIEGALR